MARTASDSAVNTWPSLLSPLAESAASSAFSLGGTSTMKASYFCRIASACRGVRGETGRAMGERPAAAGWWRGGGRPKFWVCAGPHQPGLRPRSVLLDQPRREGLGPAGRGQLLGRDVDLAHCLQHPLVGGGRDPLARRERRPQQQQQQRAARHCPQLFRCAAGPPASAHVSDTARGGGSSLGASAVRAHGASWGCH